jgi:hypothetical protein
MIYMVLYTGVNINFVWFVNKCTGQPAFVPTCVIWGPVGPCALLKLNELPKELLVELSGRFLYFSAALKNWNCHICTEHQSILWHCHGPTKLLSCCDMFCYVWQSEDSKDDTLGVQHLLWGKTVLLFLHVRVALFIWCSFGISLHRVVRHFTGTLIYCCFVKYYWIMGTSWT